MSATVNPVPKLDWTGERMIPNQSDPATELFHWQRYLYFRPWYEGKKVVDAASGEGYGIGFASNFAIEAKGFDIAQDAVDHANARYPKAKFTQSDVCAVDYSDADLVISFETIEHLPDPIAFLKALKACKGQIVISTPNRNTHSPGNKLGDKPFNQYHTVEWTPKEFAETVKKEFKGRQVRFLSQEARWPGIIREGLDDEAMYCIAVIGDGDLPQWPRIGMAIPTLNGALRVRDAVLGFSKFYPGEVEFAIVANGCNPANVKDLKQLQAELPHLVTILEVSQNIGYGRGMNVGLDYLWQNSWYDFFAVSNDDVIPATDCLPQLVTAFAELKKADQKPGCIGPVTNEINGVQKVDIGPYTNYSEMLDRAELYHHDHHSVGTQVSQLRGLFWLIDPECFSEIGGFDPRFGLGNFEDDDYNLRCRLAGYTLWVADGAFLHHQGSATFKEVGLNYNANIERNLTLMMEKWGLANIEQMLTLDKAPEGVSLNVPLSKTAELSGYGLTLNNENIDLVTQATDMEFVGFLYHLIKQRPREDRIKLLEVLNVAPANQQVAA